MNRFRGQEPPRSRGGYGYSGGSNFGGMYGGFYPGRYGGDYYGAGRGFSGAERGPGYGRARRHPAVHPGFPAGSERERRYYPVPERW
jgi:hypothetical protein